MSHKALFIADSLEHAHHFHQVFMRLGVDVCAGLRISFLAYGHRLHGLTWSCTKLLALHALCLVLLSIKHKKQKRLYLKF